MQTHNCPRQNNIFHANLQQSAYVQSDPKEVFGAVRDWFHLASARNQSGTTHSSPPNYTQIEPFIVKLVHQINKLPKTKLCLDHFFCVASTALNLDLQMPPLCPESHSSDTSVKRSDHLSLIVWVLAPVHFLTSPPTVPAVNDLRLALETVFEDSHQHEASGGSEIITGHWWHNPHYAVFSIS